VAEAARMAWRQAVVAGGERIARQLAVDLQRAGVRDLIEIEGGQIGIEGGVMRRFVEIDRPDRGVDMVISMSLVMQPMEHRQEQHRRRITGENDAGREGAHPAPSYTSLLA